MANINTNDIKVFPSANHTGWVDSRWTTEYNLTNIVNRLVNKEAFVISPTLEESVCIAEGSGSDHRDIEFNISGYWFKIGSANILNIVDAGADNIYAYLVYGGSNEDKHLLGDTPLKDPQGIIAYQGLEITTSKPTGTHLHLFTKITKNSESVWVIPRDSYIKFKSDSISLDDGDLDS